MKDATKAKLQIGSARDAELSAAEKAVTALAKDFILAKPWAAKGWDQAVHARFILWALGLDADVQEKDVPEAMGGSEAASLDRVARAVFALRIGNASAFRQSLEDEGILAPSTISDEYK